MGTPFDPAVEIHELDNHIRYLFPRRQLGRSWHLHGLAFLGVAGSLFVFVWLFTQLKVLNGPAGQQGAFELLLILKLIPLLLIACVSGLFGLFLLRGHLEIEDHGDHFRVLECLGPIRWPSSCETKDIRKLAVVGSRHDGSIPVNWIPLKTRLWLRTLCSRDSIRRSLVHLFTFGGSDLWKTRWLGTMIDPSWDGAVLLARKQNGPSILLAGGYPRAWLLALGEHLASAPGRSWQIAHVFIEDIEVSKSVGRPAGSRALLEEHLGGWKAILPGGCFQGDLFFLVGAALGVFVCFMAIVASIGIITAAFANQGSIYLLVFLLISLPLAALPPIFVYWGFRIVDVRGAVTVTQESLSVLRVGLLRTTQYEWHKNELLAIGLPFRQVHGFLFDAGLRIVLKSGAELLLFRTADPYELDWIAGRVRDSLGVPAFPPISH